MHARDLFDDRRALASRVVHHRRAGADHALWLDSGLGSGLHRLAALPDRFETLRVDTLGPRDLVGWLRERLP